MNCTYMKCVVRQMYSPPLTAEGALSPVRKLTVVLHAAL